jgi:hypothetical protein
VSLPGLSTAPTSVASSSHPPLQRELPGERFVPVLCLALMALYLSLFLRSVWRIGDEGLLVHGAQRVTSGQIPFKDFFEVIGPGAFYWLALWFKVLGVSWLTSRLAILATSLGTAYAMYLATKRIQPRASVAAVPALIYGVLSVPLWPGANFHFDSNFGALLAFAVYAGSARTRLRSFAVGMLAGLTATIQPQKGVATFGALVIATFLDGRSKADKLSHSLFMLLGFTSVGLAALVYFYVKGALGDLLYASVIWPFSQYHNVNVVPYMYGLRESTLSYWLSILRALLPEGLALLALGLIVVPLLVVAVLPMMAAVKALELVWKRLTGRTEADPSLPYWVVGTALFASESHRLDLMHVIYGSPILLMALAAPAPRLPRLLKQIVARVTVSGTLVLAVLLALDAARPGVTVGTPQGRVNLRSKDEALEFLLHSVARNERVFVYPYYSMYYFLANLPNPTRYSILMYSINTPAQFQETIDALEAQRVKFVLWDTIVAGPNLTRWFPGYRDPAPSEQLLEQYLTSHYALIDTRGGFRILQRLEEPRDRIEIDGRD